MTYSSIPSNNYNYRNVDLFCIQSILCFQYGTMVGIYHILMLRLTHNHHQINLLYDFMTLFLISEYLNMLKGDANSLFKKKKSNSIANVCLRGKSACFITSFTMMLQNHLQNPEKTNKQTKKQKTYQNTS